MSTKIIYVPNYEEMIILKECEPKLFTHASEYICPKNKMNVISITLINLVLSLSN